MWEPIPIGLSRLESTWGMGTSNRMGSVLLGAGANVELKSDLTASRLKNDFCLCTSGSVVCSGVARVGVIRGGSRCAKIFSRRMTSFLPFQPLSRVKFQWPF